MLFNYIKQKLEHYLTSCAVNRTRLGGYIISMEVIRVGNAFLGVEIKMTTRCGSYELPRVVAHGLLGMEIVDTLNEGDYLELHGNIAVRSSECDELDGYPLPFVEAEKVYWPRCEIDLNQKELDPSDPSNYPDFQN